MYPVHVYAQSIFCVRIFVKLNQNINENWKSTETTIIVVENREPYYYL